MNIEILKETAGVVLPLDRHSEAATDSGIDAVGRNQVPAADELFLVASIGVRHARRDAVAVQRQILERCVVFDVLPNRDACIRGRTFRFRSGCARRCSCSGNRRSCSRGRDGLRSARRLAGSASRSLCTRDRVRGCCRLSSLSTRSSNSTVRACMAMARDSRPGPGMRSMQRYSTPRRASSMESTHPTAPPPTIRTGISLAVAMRHEQFRASPESQPRRTFASSGGVTPASSSVQRVSAEIKRSRMSAAAPARCSPPSRQRPSSSARSPSSRPAGSDRRADRSSEGVRAGPARDIRHRTNGSCRR